MPSEVYLAGAVRSTNGVFGGSSARTGRSRGHGSRAWVSVIGRAFLWTKTQTKQPKKTAPMAGRKRGRLSEQRTANNAKGTTP